MLRNCFFTKAPHRYVSNEQPCLKTTRLYDDLLLLSSLFHFFYFIFSALISFSLFSNFSIFNVLSQVLIKYNRKAFVYININNMYNIYFRKLVNFCLKNL